VNEVSAKTKVALGLAFTAIGGGSAFCTTLYIMTDANAKALAEQKTTIIGIQVEHHVSNKEILDRINQVSQDVAVIKHLLKEK